VKAYNVRARDKSFEIGEKVIVLRNDSKNKLRSKWQTGIVVDIADEYSYLIEFTDGSRKRVHANELRPFQVRVNSVIIADDTDFGDIVSVSTDYVEHLPSEVIDRDSIAHLSVEQQTELLTLLDDFSSCFSEKSGSCTCVQHEIKTSADFVPRVLRPYKIHEILKPEVEKQIDMLLKNGFITKSDSNMISPIVCIVKHGATKSTPSVTVVAGTRRGVLYVEAKAV
jgi:hypothetical protein